MCIRDSYYCSQAMFQLGGKYWAQFAPLMYDALLEDQNADGSWTYPRPAPGRACCWTTAADRGLPYNTSYPTSLAILTLTVSARQLPIYQREECPIPCSGTRQEFRSSTKKQSKPIHQQKPKVLASSATTTCSQQTITFTSSIGHYMTSHNSSTSCSPPSR